MSEGHGHGGGGLEPEEEHENLERWLLTYADMITLLVAFFILLYSMSVINIAKFQKLALSVRSGFNGPIKASGGLSIVEKGQVSTLEHPNTPEQLEVPAKNLAPLSLYKPGHNGPRAVELEGSKEFEGAKESVATAEGILVGKGTVRITPTKRGWTIELAGDEIFFDKDSSNLTEAARLALLALAPSMAKTSQIGVEGFSSGTPAGGFGLSTQRALTVLAVLQEGGVPDEKLSATGFGVRAPDGLGGRDYVRVTLKR